jgi:hypothetical protein
MVNYCGIFITLAPALRQPDQTECQQFPGVHVNKLSVMM